MGSFLISSSIGKKLVMSISGCFLVLFITFHLIMNMTAIFSEDAYNAICAFLGANWYAVAGTMVLALGVFVHVLYALILTWQNLMARGRQCYAVTKAEDGVGWSSKNMFVLGLVVLIGLLLHLYNFWYNMMFVELLGLHENRFGYSPTDGAALIRDLFAQPVFCILYMIWLVALWFHLTHGLWSMFQSIGWANKTWYPRMKVIGTIIATLLILGFMAVIVVFYLKSLGIVIFG